MLVWLSRVFLLIAVVLAGLGVCQMWDARVQEGSEPALVIVWPARDLGEVSVGSHQIVVRVINPAGRTRRVVGMLQGCRPNVCFGPKNEGPVAVPPGKTVEYACTVDVTGPGPFTFPLHIYLEGDGIDEVGQTLHGTAIVLGGKSDGDAKLGH